MCVLRAKAARKGGKPSRSAATDRGGALVEGVVRDGFDHVSGLGLDDEDAAV